MSGISSKKGTISFAVQTAKGTPATVPTVKFALAGDPTLGPTKTRARYNMTDTGPDNGPAYTSLLAVEGGLTVFAHPDGMAFLAAAISGNAMDSGATPNYSHVSKPGDDMLWLTAWREVGGVIVEQFEDVKLSSLQIEGQAGQALTVALEVVGCKSKWLTTSAAAIAAVARLSSNGYIYPEAQGLITIDGVAKRIHQISFGINRNASGYQSDGYGYDDVDPGAREVTLSFSTRFQSGAIGTAEYAEFYYGSTGPTDKAAMSPVVNSKAFSITFQRDADTSFEIDLPRVEFAAVPVNPGVSGDPIEVQVACEVERPAGGDIYTLTTKDQKATAV